MSAPVLPWYVLCTHVLREQWVACLLRKKGFTEFVPVYRVRQRWSDRMKEIILPLFPGYMFCRLDISARLPVLTTSGVKYIVGSGKTPIPVPDSEVEAIRVTVESGLDLRPCEPQTGQRVRLWGGPLDGLEGVLTEKKSRYRLVVSVSLLQRSASVEVDRAWVKPVFVPAASSDPAPQRAPARISDLSQCVRNARIGWQTGRGQTHSSSGNLRRSASTADSPEAID